MPSSAVKEQQEEKPKAYKFSLKTPYMKQGRVTQLVAKTSNVWIHTKVNAEGGENSVHCHLDEDHSFVVLEGKMSVFDENGTEMFLEQYQNQIIHREHKMHTQSTKIPNSESEPYWGGLQSIPLKLSCLSVLTEMCVFEICWFEMIRHYKSFTNHFSGVRMVLIICFQNHLCFNRTDFTPVSTLFSKHILPKTSDFPFWNPLFSRSPT